MYILETVLFPGILAASLAPYSALAEATAESLKSDAVAACPDSEKGKVKCLAGGTYFVTCNGANSVPQQVSLGTQCVNGAIALSVAAAAVAAPSPSSSSSSSSLATGASSAIYLSGSTMSVSSMNMQNHSAESLGSSVKSDSSTTSLKSSDQSTMVAASSSTYSSIASSGLSASSASSTVQAAVAAKTPVPNGAMFDCKANNVTTRYLYCLSATNYVICGDGPEVPVFIVPIGSACDVTRNQFTTLSPSSSVTLTLLSASSSSSIIPAPVAASTPVPNGAYFNCKDRGFGSQALHCIDENTYVECADVAKPVLIVPIGSKCDSSVNKVISSSSSFSSISSSAAASVTVTSSSLSASSIAQPSVQIAAISILNSLLTKFAGQASANQATASSSMSNIVTLSTTASSVA